LEGGNASIQSTAWVCVVSAGSDGQFMPEKVSEERIDEVPFPLILKGFPGNYPCNSIRHACIDQSTGYHWKCRLASTGADVHNDLPYAGPGDYPVYGIAEIFLVLS